LLVTPYARPLLVLALLSGASSLLYQVVWSRLLTLEIGLTAAALSTVLAAFMGGLALGTFAASRRAATLPPRRALALYALLELAVGITALGVAPALTLARPILAATYHDGQGGLLFAILRLVICLIVVTVPATLMGATFPLALRWLEPRPNEPAARAGQIAGLFYAVHTFGAALGAALTGFLLLPALGLQRSTIAGVIINTIVGASAYALQWRHRVDDGPAWTHDGTSPLPHASSSSSSAASASSSSSGEDTANARKTRPIVVWRMKRKSSANDRSSAPPLAANEWSARAHPTSAAVTLAISGFIALVHEVAWTRVIALTLGPTTYAFSTMLATCILGLAAGAWLATRWLPRLRRPVTALAVTQIAAALGAFFAAALVPRLPAFVASLVASPHQFGWTLAIEILLIAILLLPMTLPLGAAFPFAVATAAPNAGDTVREASRVYTANTLGAIGGALTGGFVLIPQFGLKRTITFAGLLGVLAGVELIWRTRRRGNSRVWVPLMGLATAILGISLPSWDTLQLTSGAYRMAAGTLADVPYGLEAGALLYYDDGAAGTVSVRRLAGTIALSINGAVDASNTRDMLRQTMFAHLPLLLHAAPSDVCIIGLGSGVTAGAALAHPVDRVDTIELSREVVRASDFFTTENRAALRDPRGHLLVGDGRTHLRLASRTYDVIISEPSSPWMAGAAPLFTRELFAAARDRLNPGGLFAQRVHLQGVPRADVRSILATFGDVFPHTTLWLAGETDLLVIGSREALRPRVQELPRRWQVPGVAADFERVQVRDPFGLLMSFVADESSLPWIVSGAPVQTDDRTRLEFSAPWGLQERGDPAAWLLDQRLRDARPEMIREAEANATAGQWRDRALMLLGAGAEPLAYDAASRALALDPTDPTTLDALVRAATRLRRQSAALALVEAARAQAPDSLEPLLAVARMREATGDRQGAIDAAAKATAQFPDAFAGWELLATLAAERRDQHELSRVIEASRAQFPDRWEVRYFAAMLHLIRDEYAEAARLGEEVLKERASDPRTLAMIGAAYAHLGIRARARDAFEACIQADPADAGSYVQLARLELDSRNARRAAELYSEALVLNPRLAAAVQGLAEALTQMGRADRAAELRTLAGS
jgi:spermidine synthase